ncbi:MAG: hypothetical protein PHR71_07710 [Polaromonas sp.]|nr:hypothetical protein [Polaromonas sp.]
MNRLAEIMGGTGNKAAFNLCRFLSAQLFSASEAMSSKLSNCRRKLARYAS